MRLNSVLNMHYSIVSMIGYELRDLHEDTPAMVWDDSLCDAAQAHADEMASTDNFFHDFDELNTLAVGENLAFFSASSPGPALDYDAAVQMWYDEIGFYDFDDPGFNGATGHFTQVVWKGSTNLCMRHAFSDDGLKVYYVARYTTRGNMIEGFDDNVLPLKTTTTSPTTSTTTTTTVASSSTTSTSNTGSELGLTKHNGKANPI